MESDFGREWKCPLTWDGKKSIEHGRKVNTAAKSRSQDFTISLDKLGERNFLIIPTALQFICIRVIFVIGGGGEVTRGDGYI